MKTKTQHTKPFLITNNFPRPLGLLHLGLLFGMMILMPLTGWGQNFSGIWYIDNDDNHNQQTSKRWYLVPAGDPQTNNYIDAYYSPNHDTQNGDPEKPFLTTYNTNKDQISVPAWILPNNSVWIVAETGESSYYNIIHASSGKYVIYEVPLPNDPNTNTHATPGKNGKRKTMHLQTIDNGDYNPSTNDNFKFKLTGTVNGNINIIPKNRSGWYWNPAGNNANNYYGTSTPLYHLGMVGVYDKSTGNSIWHFESALLTEPEISDVDQNNNVTVTDVNNLPTGYNIRYTTNGTAPTASSSIMDVINGIPTFTVTSNCTLKAVVERYGVVLTVVASKYLEPAPPMAPVFSLNCDNSVSMSCPNIPDAPIRYTTDGSTPTNTHGTVYSGPVSGLADNTTVKAVAYIGENVSDVAQITLDITHGGVPVITSDDCSTSDPHRNVLTVDGPDGLTYWYTVTAVNGNDTPDAAPDPGVVPYTQYLGEVNLEDVTAGNHGYCTVHLYAECNGNRYTVSSVAYLLTTSGKPSITPPTGSSANLIISGGRYGDYAICTATGDSQAIPVASDGTAVYTIPASATGTLTVCFKRYNEWQPSCEATYVLPAAPATPTWSQSCDNLLSLHCETPMADIHYEIGDEEGHEAAEPTLTSPTYVTGCLDHLVPGQKLRAKAFLGFRASAELVYTYQPVHAEEPTFYIDGTTVTITGPSGTTIYYTKNVGVNPPDPADPVPGDPGTSHSTGNTVNVVIDGGSIITVFKAIAVPSDPDHASCVVRVVTREGYSINVASDLAKLGQHPGSYFFVYDDINATGFTGTVDSFTGVLDGNYHTISNLGVPLFNTITGADEDNNAAVLNVMLKNVSISTSGNAGAIANNAIGYTRIYNCGILPDSPDGTTTSSISGNAKVGGLVGFLDGVARVVNCFSYANITGGTDKAGIVGYNNVASTSGSLNTMVMNCMFYGNIATGNNIAPVYGGEKIHNKYASNTNTGLNNYCYFLYKDQAFLSSITDYEIARGSLGAEERFLNRFEFFRLTLNSTRDLAAFYVYNDVSEKDLMAKWVLDKNIAPYPILKEPGYYPSIINHDAEHASPIDPDNVHYNEGRKLGTLSVTISGVGTGAQFAAPSDAKLIDENGTPTSLRTLTLVVTDKDFDHDGYVSGNYDYNYKKVQLPYYNEVGIGNYAKASDTDPTGRVVTGWKITAINGSTSGTGTFTTDTYDYPSWNFVDRTCTKKDLYSESGRVFNQGAYWEVPDGVTSITIEPYWAKSVFLSDANYDVTYSGTNKYPVTVAGSCPNEVNEQTVHNTVADALTALASNVGHTVYDYAVVLVGNYHQYTTAAIVTGTAPVTFMSADFDDDHEPDNTLFYYHYSRQQVAPVRFDFLNIPGVGTVKRTWNSGANPQPGIFRPTGWFEVTNTVQLCCGQFEYASGNHKTIEAPLILQGGIYEQFVSCQQTAAANTNYLLLGGNAWFNIMANGCHTAKYLYTPKVPINVAGGEFNKFYLTGIYQPTPTSTPPSENAECYIDGGHFGEVAGAGMQPVNGDVTWLINAADIENHFYGGGINALQTIKGNITTSISNSRVDELYGGPKFGDMSNYMKVTTTGNNCVFGDVFGAGYGGTSLTRVDCEDQSLASGLNTADWHGFVSTHYSRGYETTHTSYDSDHHAVSHTVNAISTSYEYEYILHSDGERTVARFYVNFAAFSLASTKDVETSLTDCKMGTFYGGGRLGAVNGDVRSTLTDCTVTGNAFGSGYSAEAPTVEVWPVADMVPPPEYNRPAGVFNTAQVKYPIPNPPEPYTWTYTATPLTDGQGIDNEHHYIYTNSQLTNLGAVLGSATLTLDGTTTVAGNVYGGGEESAVTGNTTVNLEGGVTVHGNVYGGGNRGAVGGDSQVIIQE